MERFLEEYLGCSFSKEYVYFSVGHSRVAAFYLAEKHIHLPAAVYSCYMKATER